MYPENKSAYLAQILKDKSWKEICRLYPDHDTKSCTIYYDHQYYIASLDRLGKCKNVFLVDDGTYY